MGGKGVGSGLGRGWEWVGKRQGVGWEEGSGLERGWEWVGSGLGGGREWVGRR